MLEQNDKVEQISNEKIAFFQANMLSWYRENGRMFIWRKKGLTNYQYVIAEVLLQRTKAETVAKFFPHFVAEFPNWKALTNSDVKKVEEYLKPVGLYRQRSKRLMSLAKEMVRRNGRFPRDRHELDQIPFMGQYIANAVELLLFNMPRPLVDVNMARVIERFFGRRKMADIRFDSYLQSLSSKIVDHSKSVEINWAILDFAALVCVARSPKCITCVLNERCDLIKA